LANGNEPTTHGWGQGKLPVAQPRDPVDIDEPFQYTKDRREDLRRYQLQDHMKVTWHDAIREATAQDLLYCHIVHGACDGEDESQWQILGEILYQKGEENTDCIYIPPTAHSNGLNIREEIMYHTHIRNWLTLDITNVTNMLESISSGTPCTRILWTSAAYVTFARSTRYQLRSLKANANSKGTFQVLCAGLSWSIT
jgi:hypothetical protein